MLFSEPKIPQSRRRARPRPRPSRFSALQRAENSSIETGVVERRPNLRFSALQRAENSSMVLGGVTWMRLTSFQCSSASRKFLNSDDRRDRTLPGRVSVLFSEPKIPQFSLKRVYITIRFMFQCSSASRKFLNAMIRCIAPAVGSWFQCSSASRKFLNLMYG